MWRKGASTGWNIKGGGGGGGGSQGGSATYMEEGGALMWRSEGHLLVKWVWDPTS